MNEAAQFAPAFRSTLAELEHYVQHAVAAEAAFGAFGSMSDRGEGTFDRV